MKDAAHSSRSALSSGPVRLALGVLLVVFVAMLAGGLYATQRHDELLSNQTAVQWHAVQANNEAQRLSIYAERYFAGDDAVDLDALKIRHAGLMTQLRELREGPAAQDLLGFDGLEERIQALEAELTGLGRVLANLRRDDAKSLKIVRTCLENAVLALSDAVTVAVQRLSGPQTVSYWGNLLNLLYVSIGIAACGLVFLAGVVVAENTKSRRLADQYKAAMAEADAANRAKSRLLANVSHELRTPLNAIIGFSDVLKDQLFGALGNERYREYSGYIRDSGTHLLMLVDDLLDFAKHDAGGSPMKFETVPLVEVLHEALRMTTPEADKHTVALDLDSSFYPNVLADVRAVRQIATNLIVNAIRHSPAGGKVEVTFASETEGDGHRLGQDDRVVIAVLDRGTGIPEGEEERLLRPFERIEVDSFVSSKDDGAGLGLALAHKLAEKHGGGVTLAAREGGGTVASFSLPLVHDRTRRDKKGNVLDFRR